MDDLSTYQGALNIFQNVNCIGQTENCIIGTIVDYSKSSEFTATMVGYGALGPAGYVIGNLLGKEREERISRLNNYFFALLNYTEFGVGIMPLQGGGLKIDPAKLTPCYDAFFFFHYQELSGIKAKNYYGIRKSVKSIKITLANGKKLFFNANMCEKKLPYQEIAMRQVVEKYQ